MSLLAFVTWLNDTSWSMYLRENDYAFAIIETIHILGLAFSVGLIMWVDLRLIGVSMKGVRVSHVISEFEPWAIGGFLVMFVSGALLLFSEPLKCYNAVSFRIKAVLLVLAGLNAWLFNAKVFPGIVERDASGYTPAWRARVVGILSLTLWLGIIVAGRWTAYK
jgi:hypothetical protein